MQRFPPRIRQFIFLHFSLPILNMTLEKRPFGRLYPWLWCITQWFCYSTSHPVYRQRWLLKEAQTVCSNTMTLRIADIYNYHCSIYNTGSLMHGGWTHKYSGVKVNFWLWFYRESQLVENDHITIFCRGNMPCVGPQVKEKNIFFAHAVEPWSNTIIVLKK